MKRSDNPYPIENFQATERSNVGDEICLYSGWKSSCFTKMAGVPISNSTDYYPIILGVGPAKTSSTALFRMLSHHPEVGMGDVSAVNIPCCAMELAFFGSRWPETNYYHEYGKYFAKVAEKSSKIKYLAEKTPLYHDFPLVPNRIGKLLHPSNTWLVFTLRDPLEAHISLFLFGHKEKNPVLLDFLKWSYESLLSFESWRSCSRSSWDSLGGFPFENWTITPDVAEISVFEKCSRYYHLGVSQYKYSHTLPNWEKILPDFPKICVIHSQLIQNCNQVMDFVQNRLRISLVDLCSESNKSRLTGKERLLGLNGTNSQKLELEDYLSYLNRYFEADKRMMHAFCDRFGIESVK